MLARTRMLTIALGAGTALLALSDNAIAGTQTATFGVSANVVSQCNVITATAMSFGTYTPDATTDLTANSNIKVKCTKNSAVTVALDKGVTTGGTTTIRKLNNSGKTIDYQLFSDSDRTKNWDDGTNKVAATGAGLGTDLTFTVYGQIPKNQLDTEPGSYSDTITVTVGY